MHDALVCGRRFRTFNVVDDFNRVALAIEIDLNIPAQQVIRGLYRIVANRDYPLKMRMDNRTYRTEILDFYLFRTLNEAREITEGWLMEYNNERPHESLNNLTPEEYRLMAEKPEISKVCGTKTGMLTPASSTTGPAVSSTVSQLPVSSAADFPPPVDTDAALRSYRPANVVFQL